jgi:hypothetical protein
VSRTASQAAPETRAHKRPALTNAMAIVRSLSSADSNGACLNHMGDLRITNGHLLQHPQHQSAELRSLIHRPASWADSS